MCFTFKKNDKQTKKPVNRFLQDYASAGIRFLQTSIEVRATSHLTISMRGQRAKGKIQRNNYHHGNCEQSLTGRTSSVSLISVHRTHRNVKNR